MAFADCLDETKFWKFYISHKMSFRNSFAETRQSLIVKSHRETIFANDFTLEQDLTVYLESDVNLDYEILLMLKRIFAGDFASVDPLLFANIFIRAWPVSIKMYSSLFIYALHCLVKISTEHTEVLMMSEMILDCIDSFFVKLRGQSVIQAFSTCTKSYQHLLRGLLLFREKILKNSKGIRLSKTRTLSDLLNYWSSTLLSLNVPFHSRVQLRTLNDGNSKSRMRSKATKVKSILKSDGAQAKSDSNSSLNASGALWRTGIITKI